MVQNSRFSKWPIEQSQGNCSSNIPAEIASSGLTSGLQSSLLVHRCATGDNLLVIFSSSLAFISSSLSSSSVAAPVVISSFCSVS